MNRLAHFAETKSDQVDLLNIKYLWTIEHFNNYDCQHEISSPEFVIKSDDDYRITLYIYPTTQNENTNSSLEVNLKSVYDPNYPLKFTFSIINNRNEKSNPTTFIMDKKEQFLYSTKDFININHAKEPANGLVTNNRLRIMCEVQIMNDDHSMNFIECTLQCQSQLSKDIEFFLHNDKFSDVELIDASGRKLYAHKLILAARSPVFDGMFKHNMKEEKEGSVTIPNIDYNCLMEMMRFIYTGKVQNLENLAYDLLAAADEYALQDLKELCETVLSLNLTIDTAIATLIMADKHNTNILKPRVLNFIVQHSKDVILTSGYQSLENSHFHLVKEILSTIVNTQNKST